MEILINLKRINEDGVRKITEVVNARGVWFESESNIMSIKLKSGSELLATPISSLNHLSPPELWIRGKPQHDEINTSSVSKIVKSLQPACRSKELPAAVKLMKRAIDQISLAH